MAQNLLQVMHICSVFLLSHGVPEKTFSPRAGCLLLLLLAAATNVFLNLDPKKGYRAGFTLSRFYTPS